MKGKRVLVMTAFGAAALLLSTNVNAALANITDEPFEFDMVLENATPQLEFTEWEGTEVSFAQIAQQGTSQNHAAVGMFDWVANGVDVGVTGFYGIVQELDRNVALTATLSGGTEIVFQGVFSEDFLFASGNLFAVGGATVTGDWEMSQLAPAPVVIGLPSAGLLMISALGGVLFIPRARDLHQA